MVHIKQLSYYHPAYLVDPERHALEIGDGQVKGIQHLLQCVYKVPNLAHIYSTKPLGINIDASDHITAAVLFQDIDRRLCLVVLMS